MTCLPALMVAPNGARLRKSDHPAIPLSLEDILITARACHEAGADGLHLHLRDADGKHILDAGLYREAIQSLKQAVPTLAVQITTEAVGQYSADHQRKIALTSGATLVSTSIREVMTDTDHKTADRFFQDCADAGISLQIILYDLADLILLQTVLPTALFEARELQVLFVLGRYAADQNSSPKDLQPFLDWKKAANWQPDWAVCAFGKGETTALMHAHEQGGKLRVGFENSRWSADGSIARDNAQRVSEIAKLIRAKAAA